MECESDAGCVDHSGADIAKSKILNFYEIRFKKSKFQKTSFLKDQMEVRYFTIELQFHENGSTLKHTANLKEDLSTGFKFSLRFSKV